MSTGSPTDSQPLGPQPDPPLVVGSGVPPAAATQSPAAQPAVHPSSSSADADQRLIQQTKQQIRMLVNEIAQLAQSDVSVEDFYDEFLPRVVSALASVGGAVWTLEETGNLQLQYQINLQSSGLVEDPDLQHRHALLLKKVIDNDVATLVPPQSGSSDDEESGNPSDHLLILAPIKVDQESYGIVEIFQRPNGGPTTQRGYLRFLVQMCELASDFFKNRRLRLFQERQHLWERLEQFLQSIHKSLDLCETIYTIANEARELIEVDRVSVALLRGHRCDVEAVSGLDSVDRRADAIKLLGRLATVVVAADEPLWFNGVATRLPPQIEKTLHEYVDQAHSKLLAVIPLRAAGGVDEAGQKTEGTMLGALIVEQLKQSRPSEGLTRRTDVVAEHAASAMSNSADHSRLFMLPIWRALGKWHWAIRTQSVPKTLFIAACFFGLIASLVFVQHDFTLPAAGKIQPVNRGDVFAPMEGTVTQVHAKHGQDVVNGQLLLEMRNADLDLQYTKLLGEYESAIKRISNMQRMRLENNLSSEQQDRLSGDLAELREAADNLDAQLKLLDIKKQKLLVASPRNGHVVTWKVVDKLLHRPVTRGQVLMTVVDAKDEWELELYASERHMGYILAAEKAARAEAAAASGNFEVSAAEGNGKDAFVGLPVTFMLFSHPQESFSGRIVEIHRTAHVHQGHGNSVLLRVAVDPDKIPDLRSETTVQAKVQCGRRSVGYVWFHELIETVYSRVLFWL